MKKTVLFLLSTSLLWGANTNLSLAQNFKIDPELSTEGGVATDLGKVEFSKVPKVTNKTELNAKQQLERFVKQIKSAKGQFIQQSQEESAKQRTQSGDFAFQRPGKFVWDVKKPYEQQVISDGKTVYQYDPDLNQVSERPVSETVGASPASILFGSDNLEKSFTVESLPEKDDMVWLRATPKTSDAGMKYIDIAFANELPAQLNIKDSFGKTTSIKLRNFQENPKLSDQLFQFKAPKGVDTVKM